MTRKANISDYEQRLGRVRDYIYDHLDEDLDFVRLADIACLSPHHWHRIYHALHGETVFATVKRLRLHRAAGELAYTTASLDKIAARAGYASVAAFSRAFKPAYGLPPARYRSEGGHAVPTHPTQARRQTMRKVEIRPAPALRIAGIEHRGPYMEIGRAFDQLHGLLTQRQLYGPGQFNVAVYFDDDTITPPAQCRSMAARSVAPATEVEPPLKILDIESGTHAVLRHCGPYAEIGASYKWLFGTWLPQSGREAANRPCYEIYLNTPMDAAPKDLMTDIYLPLK